MAKGVGLSQKGKYPISWRQHEYTGNSAHLAHQVSAPRKAAMHVRMTDEESDFCKQVSATLFLQGQLEKPAISALVREALRVYLNSVWLERDVFVTKPYSGGIAAGDWPMSRDVPVGGEP